MDVSEIIVATTGVLLPFKSSRNSLLSPEDHLKQVRLEIMSLYVFSIPPGPDWLALAS